MGKEYTDAQKRATKEYLKTLKSMSIRVKPEDYKKYVEAAKQSNTSLRAYILEALDEKIIRDTKK